jgi:trk system potassium uptake protein TrkH
MLDYLGLLSWIFGLVMLAPLAVELSGWQSGDDLSRVIGFGVPLVAALIAGTALKRNLRFEPLDNRRAMLLTAIAWMVISAIGAIPLWFGLRVSFLDAYFESVSGFTTTGITMFGGLDWMPASILFWRSFMQWLGGLGILAFFLTILYTAGSANRLYSAESHKVFSRRPVPGLLHTLRILWGIYAGMTAAVALALLLEGVSLFDAVTHAMTALSTGGYSPHDASVGYYALAGRPHFRLIEYTLTIGMLAGGMSFLVHYRVVRGGFRALWDGLEMRLWWAIIAGATLLVALDLVLGGGQGAVASAAGPMGGRLGSLDWAGAESLFRTSLFQVVSILTTTGFATADIGSAMFPAASKQVFLILMVIGGCVGSTGGGIKVLRIGVLLRMVGRQLKRSAYGPASLQPVVVDGETISAEEVRRIGALFFAWIVLLGVGAIATAALSEHGPLESASGMFSALGNIGPCYIPGPDMAALAPGIKIVYILGMLAGRLEIVPLLLLFSRRSWR